MRAEVERRIEHRLLAHPDAVLHHGVDRAADRAVRADGALDLDLALVDLLLLRLGLADHVERQLAREGAGADRDAGALEERAAVDGRASAPDRLRARRDCGAAVPEDFLVSSMALSSL